MRDLRTPRIPVENLRGVKAVNQLKSNTDVKRRDRRSGLVAKKRKGGGGGKEEKKGKEKKRKEKRIPYSKTDTLTLSGRK